MAADFQGALCVVEEFLNHDVSRANRRIEQNRVENMVVDARKTVAAPEMRVRQSVGFEVFLRQFNRAPIDIAAENLRLVSSTRYRARDGAPAATEIADDLRVVQNGGFEQKARAFVQIAARKNAVSSGETQRFSENFSFDVAQCNRRRFARRRFVGWQLTREIMRC